MRKATKWALVSASALGLALISASVSAQDYDDYANAPAPHYYGGPAYGTYQSSYRGGPGYYGDANESVTIYAPRYREERSEIGAPIENVSLSAPVGFADLDLRTSWGAHALHNRIRVVARSLCDRLERAYPVAAADNPPCYTNALRDAMYRANSAIGYERGYAEER